MEEKGPDEMSWFKDWDSGEFSQACTVSNFAYANANRILMDE